MKEAVGLAGAAICAVEIIIRPGQGSAKPSFAGSNPAVASELPFRRSIPRVPRIRKSNASQIRPRLERRARAEQRPRAGKSHRHLRSKAHRPRAGAAGRRAADMPRDSMHHRGEVAEECQISDQ